MIENVLSGNVFIVHELLGDMLYLQRTKEISSIPDMASQEYNLWLSERLQNLQYANNGFDAVLH